MTDSLTSLLAVQDIDTAIDQLRHRKANLPERAELTMVNAQLNDLASRRKIVEADRGVLAKRQEELEDAIGMSRTRKTEVERRLYGGLVTASRELQALDEEVRHLGSHISELEDAEIEIMEKLEPLDAQLSALGDAGSALSETASKLTEAVKELDSQILEEERDLAHLRESSTATVPADLLTKYDALRKRLGGIGAARLVGDSCGGCHLSLPSMEVDRIRKAASDAVILCDQCGRILVR